MEGTGCSQSLFCCAGVGDPSVFGNLPPPPAAYEGVKLAVDEKKYDGYAHSSGLLETRTAVAKHYSTTEAPLSAAVSTRAMQSVTNFSIAASCQIPRLRRLQGHPKPHRGVSTFQRFNKTCFEALKSVPNWRVRFHLYYTLISHFVMGRYLLQLSGLNHSPLYIAVVSLLLVL